MTWKIMNILNSWGKSTKVSYDCWPKPVNQGIKFIAVDTFER